MPHTVPLPYEESARSILAYLEFPHHRAISILVYHFCLPKPQNNLNKKFEILINHVYQKIIRHIHLVLTNGFVKYYCRVITR